MIDLKIQFSDASLLVNRVTQAMLGMQRASWEQGVAAQALLEWHNAEHPATPLGENYALVSLANDAVVRQESSTGRLAVVLNREDFGLLDPASSIEPLLTLSKALTDSDLSTRFKYAAQKQIYYLMRPDTLRTPDGILSHRTDKLQLWIDGIYMGPPALAFAGIEFSDETLLKESFKQIQGYRDALWNDEAQLFSHIWDVPSQTMERAAYWGVGNGWAIAGMVRVLYLLPETMDAERKQLLTWIKQALDGVLVYQRPDGLFHDVLDDPSTFVDANVAQQVAYSIFRLAEHGDVGEEYLEKAIQSREAAHRRVDQFGLVQGVCGSPSFNSSGTATEGQAFFILMEAAALCRWNRLKSET